MRQIGKILGISLLALSLTLPLAEAAAMVKHASDSVECQPVGGCAIAATQMVHSNRAKCIGVAGEYTACAVRHTCTYEVTGVTATGHMYCFTSRSTGSTTSCSTLLNTACGGYAEEIIVIDRNSCAFFYVDARVASSEGSASTVVDTLRVCVNGDGAF